MEKIIITVNKQGQAHVEADGFQGPACTLKTKAIIDALGPKGEDKTKPEFYADNEQQNSQEVAS